MDNYSEGQYVEGKGIALPVYGQFRQPTTEELKKLYPTADPDLFKLMDAVFLIKHPLRVVI